MQVKEGGSCMICLKEVAQDKILFKCGHSFCTSCLKQYIRVLKLYRQLSPEKLKCLHEDCQEQIADEVILKLFPGEEGFILKTIRKCYRQSKNSNSTIFCCSGYLKLDRKTIVDKGVGVNRQQHRIKTNNLAKDIKQGRIIMQNIKQCNNIHIHNRDVPNKEKYLQCFVCGCSFCLNCFQISHEGACKVVEVNPIIDVKRHNIVGYENFQEFMINNQMRRCLNEKCGVPIAKQQGCFWVKCRCSWQMCYPCGKIWGDCQHFSKYPYKKFTPPADWLVKALQLY